MRRQGIARQQTVAIAAFNKSLHRLSTIMIKGDGRPQNPNDMTMSAIMAKDMIQIIIGAGKR